MEDKENDPLALVELGEKFRKFLIYHGVSYSELAKQVDILTRDTVQLMTAGARDRFTSKNLLRCLKGLVILEKLTEENEARNWLEDLYTARGIRCGEQKYIALEEMPEGREILELIKHNQEHRLNKEEIIWNVPHLHNVFFTGREEILARLHTKFSSESSDKPIALT